MDAATEGPRVAVPRAAPVTGRPTPLTALTTFPNPFRDEPEPGILPSLLSKVKSTFGSTPVAPPAPAAPPSVIPASDGNYTTGHGLGISGVHDGVERDRGSRHGTREPSGDSGVSRGTGAQTEAQMLAAAVKERQATLKLGHSGVPIDHGLTGYPIVNTNIPPTISVKSPQRSDGHSLQIPASARSSQSGSKAPSLATTAPSQAPSRKPPPSERSWRPPALGMSAKSAAAPITGVTATLVAADGTGTSHLVESVNAEAGPSHPRPRAHFAPTPMPHVPSPIRRHHRDSLSSNFRPRRSSFATIPDSPSSVSLSAMIHNAELSQNVSYVPGFPIGQDDTRSVRSLGLVKKSNSVSRIIRRMRGEGLSKHYWMLDEHCKECYDCKSVFTAWRRKHHCRICGQIFCSRCASNIIGARRFGQEGAVRVCNLCLKIMEEYRDDDDARSINSVATSARLPHSADRAIDTISPDLPYSKSPFAASQLFSINPDDTLDAIEEGVPVAWSAEQDGSSPTSDDEAVYDKRPPVTAVPFRRAIEEEHRPAARHPAAESSQPPSGAVSPVPRSPETLSMPPPPLPTKTGQPKKRRVEFPRTETTSTEGDRAPLVRVDSNQLIGLRTRLSSRTSQSGLTSLIDAEKREGLWRARSNSFALHHLHLMLEQAIGRAGLPNAQEWHRVLSGILIKLSTHVSPNVPAGDSIDVRAYVKIKKVPGGKITDSEYVDGIVISKNVAHKAMPRRLVNPRIMVVTFPLDYHRVENQFMSLDPIMAQEKDYLRLLTRRIIDVRPHIVLVERSASRLALDHLLAAGIAVARCVKLSAIHQVARCTQADVVASMDRLALEPRLGRCAEFSIQSFDHELIPGRRKTIMRFEGCQRELGCTIILRGGDIATLRKVKQITDFMSFVVYQLKNEMVLYSDEHNILPIRPPLETEYQQLLANLAEKEVFPDLGNSTSTLTPPSTAGRHPPQDDRGQERTDAEVHTREIARSLEPYLTTIFSASASIRFPPPAPLVRMATLDRELHDLLRQRDEDETKQILQEERKEQSGAEGTSTIEAEALTEKPMPANMSALVPPPTAVPPNSQRLKDPYRVLRKPEEITRDSNIAQLKHAHAEYLKFWQLYNRRHPAPLSPENYQNLIYLYSLSWDGGEKPCIEPVLKHTNFYQKDDETLGQYLERLTAEAAKACKACDRSLLTHFQLLVHGSRRLQIAVDRFPCPSPGHEERIITWSYCRICAVPSPTTILRDETWKMSWGAYLEHCFYPPQTSAGFNCEHDAFRDQIRYFAHNNLAIRIHNEAIDLFDPVRPSIVLQIKAETKVTLKNQEYEAALQKTAAFFDSVLRRLRTFDQDICHPEKVGSLHSALEGLLSRAVADREEMVNLLNRSYKLSPITDVLALNAVLRALQDKVVQWDTDFADVEKNYLPSEKDLRRMTASHLKRLFAQQDGLVGSLDKSVAGLTVSEADEKEGGQEAEEVLTSCDSSIAERPGPSRAASEGSALSREDDMTTPMATIAERRNPMSPNNSQGGESDSTIGKTDMIRQTPLISAGIDTSEMESDGYFVSRIPRRPKPASSIADLVKRFQESSAQFEALEELEEQQWPASSNRRHRKPEPEQSDSDTAFHVRPKLRRGRTDMPPPVRQREVSMRAGMISDGDRSYAQNASRSPYATKRPALSHRSSGLSASPNKSGRNSPELGLLTVPPSKTLSRNSSKTRLSGKGSAPRDAGKAPAVPSLRPHSRRSITATPSNRVTSIARHFDRLSRDAERERVKRHAVIRSKRARPVAATKAKVQVFRNVRDAFRDESESDSSEADDEDNNSGDDDADSDDDSRRPTKTTRKSPQKGAQVDLPEDPVATPPMPITSVPAESDTSMPISISGQSLASSNLGEIPSGQSFTDRLKIELPSFETSAPLPSVPATPQLSVDTADEDQGGGPSQLSGMSESELSSGGERSSILKTLTGLWAFRAGEITPLVYPLSANDHIFADSRVIIRENEPTSIIAFTLNSKLYRDKMKNATYAQSVRSEAFMPEEGTADRVSTWDVVSLDEAMDADDPYRREGGTHLKYDFDSGSSNIFCRIFFAEQFAALRSACQCEDSFVESLARCVQFDASGGKSGSAFLKTKDDRFICKEISRLEMDALTKFAPAYFDYTKKAFQGQRPTVLAKIYGFFKIGYRNAVTGRAMRMNVLVMENLFYERRFSKIYDLKGSTRNRLIQATGKVNEVLLDENLMEIAQKHPLYLREHSKRVLRTALFNDTLFLSNLNVMDYSLVVGVDQEKRELVVGIVDYIRTFTWDKKLESWVKDSAFLGGAKGEPTIVTPKQYKARFRAAMERFYFPSVPDRWSKMGAEEPLIEEENALTTIV